MIGKRLNGLLGLGIGVATMLTLVTSACTPADAQALQGVLQNVDSAKGTITLVTNDGKTITLNINTSTTAETGGNVTALTGLKPGDKVEISTEDNGKAAKHIKAQHQGEDNQGKGENENEGKPAANAPIGSGIVELRVTDPPPAGVKSAVVNFTGVEIHMVSANQGENDAQDDKGSDNKTAATGNVTSTAGNATSNQGSSWIPVPIAGTSFDLMSVVGVEKILGAANITAGKFTEIRFAVTNVTGITTDNKSFTAEVPGDKLKIVGPFTVGSGNTTVLTLDFDGEKSLVLTGDGKFIFKPVVKLLVNGKAPGADSNKGESESNKPADAGKGNKPGATANATDSSRQGTGGTGDGKGKGD